MNGHAASSIYIENERPTTCARESTTGRASKQRYGESGCAISTRRALTPRKRPPLPSPREFSCTRMVP